MDNFGYLLKEEELYSLAEQLSQSNNKKRLITDVSISKIPYVVYPDLDTNLNLVIHELAEHLLFLAKKDNDSNEVAITFNLEDNFKIKEGIEKVLEKVGICFGTQNETDLFSDTQTMSIINRARSIAVINMHNHPSCSSFSVTDISTFLKESVVKMMIVIGNNGELYYLSKDKNYNHNKARRYLTDVGKVIMPGINDSTKATVKDLRTVADIFLKNSSRFGIEYRHILGTNKTLKMFKVEDKNKNDKENDDYEY